MAPKPGPVDSRKRTPDRWLCGLHAVAEAWANPERSVLALRATETGMEALQPAFARAREAGLDRPKPQLVERKALDGLFPPGTVHQGAAIEVQPLPPVSLDDLGRMAEVRGTLTVLALDQVTDPHNIGAILRSAAAFGAAGVVVTDRHTPEVTAALAKTASGAVEHVPMVRVTNLARALGALGEWGFRRIGLAEEGAVPLADAPVAERVCLVLGAEGEGLRKLTRETCDALVALPTDGPIASLNVSNAAAVALYEMARRRSGG